jgi:hypothetical protein
MHLTAVLSMQWHVVPYHHQSEMGTAGGSLYPSLWELRGYEPGTPIAQVTQTENPRAEKPSAYTG